MLQKTLAKYVTRLIHGGERAEQAEHITRILMETSFDQILEEDYAVLEQELPSSNVLPRLVAVRLQWCRSA